MALVPVKRRQRVAAPVPLAEAVGPGPGRFPGVVLCLVERGLGARRWALLAGRARAAGFSLHGPSSAAVTHVVAEQCSAGEALAWLARRRGSARGSGPGTGPALLDLSWLLESLDAGRPLDIEPRHRLPVTPSEEPSPTVPAYGCQRRTPLAHHNATLTEALETLARDAAFGGDERRSLAFTRAASVLKALPRRLGSLRDLAALPGVGEHCRRVIQEVLEDGSSAEVEAVRQSERYRTMQLFTGIFGVGTQTAARWYQDGLQTLADLRAAGPRLSRQQQAGLQHWEDLATPVALAEAEAIRDLVRVEAERVLLDATVTLVGGFRRGKPTGHDVDLLLSHPEEGREQVLLGPLVTRLEQQGLLLYQQSQPNTFRLEPSSSTMDQFERCFAIVRWALPGVAPGAWRAVRVDLVVVPCSQFAFALLGWTGSRHFERELRRFASCQRGLALSSHGLYDPQQEMFLPATSEEEIFQLLGLDYVPPAERNA
ncbi:DNA-directed DNA/RNA polymerase mu [Struthio camelus]|uniref:DNA-directed DNA/RNA polymerase mu n=1 Tax=Struthio camelus TaxID=8801 RepID=UPI00360406F5